MFYALLVALLIGLLALEPHMSAAMIITVVAFSILFVAGMKVWFLVPLTGAGIAIIVLAYFNLSHVHSRLKVFLDPFSDAAPTRATDRAVADCDWFMRAVWSGTWTEPAEVFVFAGAV